MASRSYFSPRGLSDSAADARHLLNRYPDISEQELAALLRTFARLPLIDFGLLASDEHLGARLDLFYADHGDKLRPPLPRAVHAAVAVATIVALALLYLAMG